MDTYDDVIKKIDNGPMNLLLGNGFSIECHEEFSYNSLSEYLEEIKDPKIKEMYQIIDLKNFEQIMRQLDDFCQIARLFGKYDDLVKRVKEAREGFKSALISAIQKFHPDNYKIENDKYSICEQFLLQYFNKEGYVFTTNYDLLLYWVIVRMLAEYKGPNNPSNGFGKDDSSDDIVWGKNRLSQNIFFIHGALHLFNRENKEGIQTYEVIKEKYEEGKNLLDKVRQRIESSQYPIFVSAGNYEQKLLQINTNPYLSYCYKRLCSITGSLVSFGIGFRDNDKHIIEAMKEASKDKKLKQLYISVYKGDVKPVEYVRNELKGFMDVKDIIPYDAETAPVWSTK